MQQIIKIAIADDEVLIRQGIINILCQEENIELVFEAANGNELIAKLNTCLQVPDIILMDINMPDLNGIDTTTILSKQYPEIKIIALSSYNSLSFIKKMLSVGAV